MAQRTNGTTHCYTGEFTGLSYEEAMAVGQRAKHYGDAVSAGRWTATYDDTYEGTANNESNPDVFSDGEHEQLSQQLISGCL